MDNTDLKASYTGFASVYDRLMDNVPYDEWAAEYRSILHQYGIDNGLVCDLGCGTGNMTLRLQKTGYDMIGVDDSDAMLDVAKKKDDSGSILFLNQDMCCFELYGTVRAVTLACDSINYLLEEEDVLTLFSLVNNYLDPGGIFIFDFNTSTKYRDQIGDGVIAENREDLSFIWENYYDEESGINECDLTIFTQKESGLFERFQETHLQRGYDLETMKRLLEKAGMEFLSAKPLPDSYGDTEANIDEDIDTGSETNKDSDADINAGTEIYVNTNIDTNTDTGTGVDTNTYMDIGMDIGTDNGRVLVIAREKGK